MVAYSTMVSRSAMSPRTIRCMMLLCSSSERFLYETRGMLYFVAGDGSTPCSQGWFSISSKDARRFGSLCNIRVIRLGKRKLYEYISVYLQKLLFLGNTPGKP